MTTDKHQRADDSGAGLPGIESLLPVDDHVEEVSVDGRKERHRGIYLLPNLFTTGALFAGFYAVVAGMQGRFETAAVAIFIAMLLDGLDGRVARLTNTQSKFGAEYDSLSDMVSFGVAPALVVFSWSLNELGKFGWAAAFIYVACAALRLARFNTQIDTADKNFFSGLASPAAAAVMAGLVWVCNDQGWVGEELPGVLAFVAGCLTVAAGLLMISSIKYHSFKGIDFHGRVPFVAMILIVLAIGVVMLAPSGMLLAAFLLYAASGPTAMIYRRLRAHPKKENSEQ